MALSMEEQRILAEIEQRLAKSEPALAARLASFGRPGPVNVLRSPRVRVLASCVALVCGLSGGSSRNMAQVYARCRRGSVTLCPCPTT